MSCLLLSRQPPEGVFLLSLEDWWRWPEMLQPMEKSPLLRTFFICFPISEAYDKNICDYVELPYYLIIKQKTIIIICSLYFTFGPVRSPTSYFFLKFTFNHLMESFKILKIRKYQVLTQPPDIISPTNGKFPFLSINLSLTKSLTVSLIAFSGATPINWGTRPR